MVFVYAFIDYLGEFFGLPYNQVKIVLCFFLSVFFSYMMVFIKSKNSRYAFSFISGFCINVFMYEWQVMHPIAMLLITYFCMKYLNRDKQHLIIFVVLYTYQSWMHIDRMIYNFGEWGGEVTSFTMNLVCRLISLGFCYRDAIHQGKGGIPNDKSINKLPSFFQVWSYTFNAPSCVAGPFFEYKDFEDWMELKGHYQSVPSTTYSGIKRLLTSLLWIPLASFFHTFYKIEGLASEDFCNKSFLRKVVQMYFTGMTLKYQYYLVWALNDTSLVFSGLAYSGVDKDTKMPEFNRVKNINEYIVDTCCYLKKTAANWNISIATWLKKYIYNRLAFNSNGNPTLLDFFTTFMISAFWHGFYPGYYFFFIFYPVLMHLSGEVRGIYSWYFKWIPGSVSYVIGWVYIYLFSVYISPVFALYNLNHIFYFLNCQYWWGHIVIFSGLAFTLSPIGMSIKRHILKLKKAEKKNKEMQNAKKKD